MPKPSHHDLNSLLSLPGKTDRPKMVIVAVWPCGSRWTIDKPYRGDDWTCPHFKNGEQTGMRAAASTRRELLADLASEGVKFERVTIDSERAR